MLNTTTVVRSDFEIREIRPLKFVKIKKKKKNSTKRVLDDTANVGTNQNRNNNNRSATCRCYYFTVRVANGRKTVIGMPAVSTGRAARLTTVKRAIFNG